MSGDKDFAPGKYYIKETKGQLGYKQDNNVYEITINENSFAELTVTNEAKKGTAVIEVQKELDGDDVKKYTFKFQLIDDEGTVIQTKTNDENGLVKFDVIEYTTSMGTYKNYTIKEIKENKVGVIYDEHEEFVTVTISDNGEDTLLCTPVYDGDGAIFENKLEKVDIDVTKTWDDNDNQANMRPSNIKVNLLKNGTKIDSKEITSQDNWTVKFEGLLKYSEDGQLINYTVTEDEIPNYTQTINGYNIKNTYTTINISGKKVWEGDKLENRPESINLILKADGKIVNNAEIEWQNKDTNIWNFIIKNLPQYNLDGTEINYEVTEGEVEQYTVSYPLNEKYTIVNKRITKTEIGKYEVDESTFVHGIQKIKYMKLKD